MSTMATIVIMTTIVILIVSYSNDSHGGMIINIVALASF